MSHRWRNISVRATVAIFVLQFTTATGIAQLPAGQFVGSSTPVTANYASTCPTCRTPLASPTTTMSPTMTTMPRAPITASPATGVRYYSPAPAMRNTTAFAPTTVYRPAPAMRPTTVFAPTTVYQPAPAAPLGTPCVAPTTARPSDRPWFPNAPRFSWGNPFRCFSRRGDPCRTPVAAVPAYVPTAPTVPCQPCNPCAVPCQPCNPCAVPCQPAQVMVCQYAPQSRYRTTWQRVPVTCYRPTISRDPCTGCPVTAMQPCVTYRWQAQRVPVSGLRGFCSSLFRRPTVTANYVSPCTTPAASYCSPSACGPSACSGGVMPGPVTGVPSMAPSLQTVPPMPVVPGALQSIPPAKLSPGATTTPGAITAPGGTQSREAADEKPRLNPIPATETGGVNEVPRRRLYDKPYDDVPGKHDVMPIPDPDAEPGMNMPGLAPPYLNPEDRTAARLLPHRWAATKISWPVREKAAEPVSHVDVRPTTPEPEPPATKRWDDSGWRSVKP